MKDFLSNLIFSGMVLLLFIGVIALIILASSQQSNFEQRCTASGGQTIIAKNNKLFCVKTIELNK